MITEEEIIVFIYSLVNSGFKIWLQERKLKLYVPENQAITSDQDEFIRNNKLKIIEVLEGAGVYNKEYEILILPYNSEHYPLSFAQSRLWFVDRYEEGSNAYNIPMLFRVFDSVNLDILEQALKEVVTRHLILNMLLKEDNQGRTNLVLIDKKSNPFKINKYQIAEKNLDELMISEVDHVFDLTKEYPIKISFYTTENGSFLSIVVNHIVFDGWSLGIFLHDIQNHFQRYLSKSNDEFCSTDIQYKDFAFWQLKWIDSFKANEQLNYWVKKLDSYENLNLATDRVRPAKINYQGDDYLFKIDEKDTKELREIAGSLNVSLYSLLLSAYYLMLNVYSSQDDIVVGTTSANRHYPELQGIIGCFINSLALRMNIDQQESLSGFINNVWNEVSSGQIMQDLPFEKIVDELGIPKDMSRHPIFQVMFVMQTHVEDMDKQNLFEEYKPQKALFKIAKFDLSAFIYDASNSLMISFNYQTSLFNFSTIEKYAQTYLQILKQVILSKDSLHTRKLADLKLIDDSQYHKLINQWNQSANSFVIQENLVSLFEDQVRNNYEKIALEENDIEITYGDLNKRANQLAHYLKHNFNIQQDQFIIISLNRSIDLLVSIIATLKCGAAYVPIDPSYPEERKKYIIEDTKAALVVDKKLLEEIDFINFSSENINSDISNNDLAYVIYTSGTTGVPKGVLIEHRSAVNYIYNVKNYIKMSSEEVVDFSTNIGFDLTVTTTICALCLGSKIAIYNDDVHDLEAYKKHLVEKKITLIKLVPSYFELLIEYLSQTSIRKIILGGEKLNNSLISKLNVVASKLDLYVYDEYGPTETTVGSLISCVFPDQNYTIGRGYDNYQTYILDRFLRPIPIGAVGELYIGGAGLARGYLNRPDLTDERFINNPFYSSSKLYKTGDLVRYKDDGNIEYIGRSDSQVKVRGFRIELAEIESALNLNYDLEKAVVILKKDGNDRSYIVAYFTSKEFVPSNTELKEFLEEKLPEYMIPSYFIYVESFPLTINGKLNYQALPDPLVKKDNNYIAPRSDLEKQVSIIWAEVLRIDPEKMGIRDDFFMLGGDSIISIQLVSRLRQKLNLNITIKDVFQYRSIERLFDNVLNKDCIRVETDTEQGVLEGPVDLLPIQYWFFDHHYPMQNHWNQVILIKVPELEIEKLKISIQKLISYHDAFRLRYKLNDIGHFEQYYNPEAASKIDLEIFDIRNIAFRENSTEFEEELQKLYTTWQSKFDIVKGPMHNIVYVYGFSDKSSRIFLATHRLIIDMVSWRILVEDLENLYNGGELGNKGSSYRQWVKTHSKYELKFPEERKYWQNIMRDYDNHQLEVLKEDDYVNNITRIDLSENYTHLLLKKCNQTFNTQINDLLLVAFSKALYDLTGRENNHILLEGHGREEIDPKIDISRTMGWFSSLYSVRLASKSNMFDSIIEVKENLRLIPNKGVGYGAIFGYSLSFLPKICFNYHGQFDREAKDGNWKITRENKGTQIHPFNFGQNIIDVNGSVIDNVLHFYISGKLSEENLKILAKSFKENLERVIDYTSNSSRTYLTPSDIEKVISTEHLLKLQKDKEIEAIYLANSLQQGFVYHSLNQGNIDDAYIVQITWEYHAAIIPAKLKEAWKIAQEKFPSLRIRFDWQEELIQVIDKYGSLSWHFIDISKINEEEQLFEIEQVRSNDRQERYSLDQASLFRIYLIKQSEHLYTCIFSSHHSIMDGWSNPVLLSFVHEVYLELLQGKLNDYGYDHSYKDSQLYLQNSKHETAKYWQEYINKIEDYSDLTGLIIPSKQHIKLKEYKHILDPQEKTIVIEKELYHSLKELTKIEGFTLNSILQYIWHKILNVYGNSKQTIVGTTISGRSIPIDHVETSVGLFINTLPIILNHDDGLVIEQIKRLSLDINELNIRSNQSLSNLQTNGERLFENLFVYENYPRASENVTNELGLKFIGGKEKLDYPFAVIAFEIGELVVFKIKYAGELFSQLIIEDMLDLAKLLLEQIVENPNIKANELKFISNEKYLQTIKSWNSTEKNFHSNILIHNLFEEQVVKNPNAIAVSFEQEQLTYRQLDERSNKVAHYLIKSFNIIPDSLVAISLERSELMLISILAILKAGAAYVPIDPNFLEERKNYIINDSKALTVINEEIFKRIDFSLYPTVAPKIDTNPCNLAYVIYTSGTTGLPKGVMIEHVSLVNRLNWMNESYPLKSSDVILQKTPYVFDVSVWELLWPVCFGSKLVFAKPGGHQDPKYIAQIIEVNKVSIIHFVPSMLKVFLDSLEINRRDLSSLRCVLTSGEELKLAHVKQFFSVLPSVMLENLYGPTECTIDVLSYSCNKDTSKVYIGKPIYNTCSFILNSQRQILPIGAAGELYIGGIGVARGYLNREELTKERFIKSNSENLYKTGDIVRYNFEGNIEYLGRNDFQTKIRGYRIELGEIENTLSKIGGIQESIVIAKTREDGSKYLVGYYMAKEKIDEKEIISYLEKNLPEYMIPSRIMFLQELPLTINGKLDRNALPLPEQIDHRIYLAPRDHMEKQISEIWADILKVDKSKISINDSFFYLGGDSILAIKLMVRINKCLETFINLADVITNPTIEKLSNCLRNVSHSKPEILGQKFNKAEEQVLSFAQARLWFIDQYENENFYYNIPMLYKLSNGTSLRNLEKALKKLIDRHEVLKSVIINDQEGHLYQKVLEREFSISLKLLSNDDILENEIKIATEYVFNLSKEWPIRVSAYKYQDNIYLCIVVHHIAFDGWSIGVFLKDLEDLYLENELAELPIQYVDFACWQRNYLQGHILQSELQYWSNKLTDFQHVNLITDFLRPKNASYRGKNYYHSFDVIKSNNLRQIAKGENVSLYSLLLSAYFLMLRTYSFQDDIIIGVPLACRNLTQIENLIGFFVNSVCIRCKISGEFSLKDFIEMVNEEVLAAQLHQDLPFEKLVEALAIEKDTSRHPIFQHMFSLQNFAQEAKKSKILDPYLTRQDIYEIAKFDLSTLVNDRDDKLEVIFNFATSLYEEATIARFADTFSCILEQYINYKGKFDRIKIKELDVIDKSQYKMIVKEWNSKSKEYPKDKTINQVFEGLVDKMPDQIALFSKDRSFTYKELNILSNKLAHFLKENYAVKPDDIIAICFTNKFEMIISLIAIIKAGAAYVSIDPNYPQERKEFILKDTKALVLLNEDFFKLINLYDYPENNICNESKSNNLAYVVYTSGTSGLPKAVMIEHKAIVSLITSIDYIDITKEDVFIQLANMQFDISNFEIWGSLLSGAKLFLLNEDKLDLFSNIDLFKSLIVNYNISIMLLPKTLFNQLFILDPGFAKNVKYLLIGGEALDKDIINEYILSDYAPKNIFNSYGPAENSIISSNMIINKQYNRSIPIGSPCANRQIYILDNYLKPLPIGAIGEIYVGGDGLARGYLNHKELTLEKFIDDPFNEGKKLYKTGDIGRWIADGNIEYIGRDDQQVKINGVRIELSEIESILAAYPSVRQALAVTKISANKEKFLVAYYLAEDKIENQVLLEYLNGKLPKYMVPMAVIHIKQWPLTINGKIDLNALPEVIYELLDAIQFLPEYEIEYHIQSLWADVLKKEKEDIFLDDDFFKIGGSSLLAITLVNKINKECNSHLKVSDIFVNSTIRAQCSALKDLSSKYNLLVELNDAYELPQMFMVHPGYVGSEVYLPLAKSLSNYFYCFGIDSYNLYHDIKIDDLNKLANHYLGYLNKEIDNENRQYNLLGWSLGGQIALEMAAILESRGEKNIRVYLIDSLVPDDCIRNIRKEFAPEEIITSLKDKLKEIKYSDDIINNAISNFNIETRLVNQDISLKLNHTKVTLFKATEFVNESNTSKKLNEYIKNISLNNLDQVVASNKQITLIEIKDVDHWSILKKQEIIIDEILKVK